MYLIRIRTATAQTGPVLECSLSHKVTHGFRSGWGADLFAQVRSLVNIARRQGISAFDAISRALTAHQSDWLLS